MKLCSFRKTNNGKFLVHSRRKAVGENFATQVPFRQHFSQKSFPQPFFSEDTSTV